MEPEVWAGWKGHYYCPQKKEDERGSNSLFSLKAWVSSGGIGEPVLFDGAHFDWINGEFLSEFRYHAPPSPCD